MIPLMRGASFFCFRITLKKPAIKTFITNLATRPRYYRLVRVSAGNTVAGRRMVRSCPEVGEGLKGVGGGKGGLLRGGGGVLINERGSAELVTFKSVNNRSFPPVLVYIFSDAARVAANPTAPTTPLRRNAVWNNPTLQNCLR